MITWPKATLRVRIAEQPPNQALHLPGAAILVSRDTTSHRRPRQVSFIVRR
jgi:hypothetical protein